MISDNSHAVIVYVENELNLCFSFVLGCCFGQHWTQVVCDDPPMDGAWPHGADERRWENYARAMHTRTEMTGLGNVNQIPDLLYPSIVTHTHIPRSILGVRLIISKSFEPNSYRTWIDVTQCTGCCTSVHRPVSPKPQTFNTGFDNLTLELFEEIRRQFRVLQQLHPEPAPQENARKQADNGHYATEAITFFVDIFSAKRFRDWIGDIYFFSDLPSLVPTRTTYGREISSDAPLHQDSEVMLDSSPCRGLFSVESFSSTHLTSDAERESKALIELEIRVRRLVTSLIEKLEPPDRYLDNEGIVEQMVCEAEDLKSEIFGIEVDV
ncbi:hypothetical protein SCLCIDRAFT_339702 [Scleroderma citrinum Foug A]|uniref:Uncharacterized protein n=1 Tax=Scleroderma citrinum Foug A TaxID=1036808 RepID=A0A0C2ZQF7_9AGAM|nr:hypothetical protein SCLCIDRAFT_339702 [Scleroderma citrinum Foug A]